MPESPHEDELLGAYLDGELDGPSRERVSAHLRLCALCRDELEHLRGLQKHVQEVDVPDPGAAYWRSFSSRVAQQIEAPVPASQSSAVQAGRRHRRSWWLPAPHFSWGRMAGAAAVVVLLAFVGVRVFSPVSRGPVIGSAPAPQREASEVQAPPASRSMPEGAKGPIASLGREEPVAQAAFGDSKALARSKEEEAQEPARSGQGRSLSAVSEAPSMSDAERPTESVVLNGAMPPAASQSRDEADKSTAVAVPSLRTVVDAQPEGRSELELEVRHPPGEVEEQTLRFVTAALASDAATARVLAEDLRQVAAGDTVLLGSVNAWLQSGVPSAPAARSLTAEPQPRALLALDALVWPHRNDAAWQTALEEVARRLVAAAPRSETLRSRAVAHAEWWAQESPDEAGRAHWRETLDRLQR